MKGITCKITLAEARLIQRFHADATMSATDPETEKMHDSRFAYWGEIIERGMQSEPAPDHKLHSYTHSTDGDLIRLDAPVG